MMTNPAEIGDEDLSSGDQDRQRPDGCRRCVYSPGPDRGVRTSTSPVCPVHSEIAEHLVCYTIRIESMENGRWRTVVEHDEYISAGSPEDAATDIIGTTPEIAPIASPLWRARVWLGHRADADADPVYLIDSVSVEHRMRMALEEDEGTELVYATREIAANIIDSAIHESLRSHPGDSRAAEANLAIFAIDPEWHAAVGLVIDRLVERGVLYLDEIDFDMTGALHAAGADFSTGKAGDDETWKVWLPDGSRIEILAGREEIGGLNWEGWRYDPLTGLTEVLTTTGDPVELVKKVKGALQ